jgi:hypothetical protein
MHQAILKFWCRKHTAYAVLKEASKVLFDRRFTYQSLTDKGNVKLLIAVG